LRRIAAAAAEAAIEVIGGVDTHQDLHHAAVISRAGEILGTRSFATTRAGYRAMLWWLRGYGEVIRVGVEQTGSYGAGLTRHLALAGIPVLEVTGPDPSMRRAKGKDDTLDAIAAAKAALTGERVSVAKDRSGQVEALRVLRTTRKTAVKCRRATMQQLRNTIIAAPDEVRDQVRNLTPMQLLRTCAAWRPDQLAFRDPTVATKIALRSLARRLLELGDEIAELDQLIKTLVAELAPGLLALEGVGAENAGELLVTAGDNPDRLTSEAGFSMLCGSSPIPASSGKTVRHRLNRGGNRQANSALHMIVVCRMRTDQRTRDYVDRRLTEGKTKREIMRCLKRYVAREIYRVLTDPSSGVPPVERPIARTTKATSKTT
jgi:transposase